MTSMLSNAHRVEIVASLGVPYALPASSGDVIDLGTSPSNIYQTVRHPVYSFTSFRNVFFGSFTGGVFNPHYGTHGAFVFCAGGGHSVQQYADSVILDMNTGAWVRRDNANNHTLHQQLTTDDVAAGALGPEPEPWCEFVDANPANVPAPSHQYLKINIIPPAWGGGTHGSALYCTGGVTQQAPSGPSKLGAHKMNLAPGASPGGLWSRCSANIFTDTGWGGASESCQVFDEDAGRSYFFFHNMNAQGPKAFIYWDASDTLFKSLPFTGGNDYPQVMLRPMAVIDPVRNLIIIKYSTTDADTAPVFIAFQRANLNAGYTTLNVANLNLRPIASGGFSQWLWQYRPVDDRFYCYPGYGNLLHMLVPPASGDPLTGQWSLATRTLNSTPRLQFGGTHYCRFVYVPTIDCFAWVADSNLPAQLIRP